MGLLGGVSALAILGAGQASAAPSPGGETAGLQPARSFGDLLDPIPNASRLLRAEDERNAGSASAADKPVVLAQDYYHHHHHHYYYHHHHHHYYHHHHHHHYYHHHHHHYWWHGQYY